MEIRVQGAEKASGTLVISAENKKDLTDTEEDMAIRITDASGKEIKDAEVKKNTITIPVSGKESVIKIENLPLYGDIKAKSEAKGKTEEPASCNRCRW